MKKIIILILLTANILFLNAQSLGTQTLNTSGHSSIVGSIQLEWSIGEMTAVQTFNAPSIILTQGLLQPVTVLNTPLPITLLYFTGKTIDNHNLLSWATSQEINNHHFDVERSSDGIVFHVLKQVQGAGNSSATKTYNLIDSFPYPATWYRLKQVDIDGKNSYSIIIRIQVNSSFGFGIYPNPASGSINLLVKQSNKPLQISIFNVAGKLVLQKNISSASVLPIDIQHLSSGAYFIKVREVQTETNWSTQFIKQ